MSVYPQRQPNLLPTQLIASDSAQWRQIIKQHLDDTRVSTPAFLVEDMDQSMQTVTVQVAIQERVRTDKGAKWFDVPPIGMVPVVLPRGGGYCVTLPLKKGDEGLLVFCDTCFDYWWGHGQTGPKADNLPADANVQPSGSQRQLEVRRHDAHDCGFIPGIWSQQRRIGSYSYNSMQIRSDDGAIVVDISESTGVQVRTNTGTALPLVNDNFYQWFIATYMPSVHYISTAPPLPSAPETTLLKGQ
jgi:hypothetical protein